MRECSYYSDRRIPSLYANGEIGWVLLTKSAGRSIGFVSSAELGEIEGEDAVIIPETAYGNEN